MAAILDTDFFNTHKKNKQKGKNMTIVMLCEKVSRL